MALLPGRGRSLGTDCHQQEVIAQGVKGKTAAQEALGPLQAGE
jgi:hypothetical protein